MKRLARFSRLTRSVRPVRRTCRRYFRRRLYRAFGASTYESSVSATKRRIVRLVSRLASRGQRRFSPRDERSRPRRDRRDVIYRRCVSTCKCRHGRLNVPTWPAPILADAPGHAASSPAATAATTRRRVARANATGRVRPIGARRRRRERPDSSRFMRFLSENITFPLDSRVISGR